ncbi:uncharacterized protein PAC_17138 [Phialocephala subalpina]|uniref:BZIP domain-containing protein n=1 Tax=Phialocephala subalpina TaxID=576137 RepID=A0A1L7XQD3_9HELO|nr:uncharacterized protein PAC_17138 [Phialocephala subalpina]
MSAQMQPEKPVSERRRMQNKQAQQNYRARQKRNLQVLQDIATSRHGFVLDGANEDGRSVQPEMGICTNSSPGLDAIYDTSLIHFQLPTSSETENMVASSSGTGQSRGSLLGPDQQPRPFPIIRRPLTPECPHEPGTICHILEREGVDLDEKTKFQLLKNNVNLQSILEAGVKAISRETSSEVICTTSYEDEEGHATDCTQFRADKLLVLQNVNNEYVAALPDVHRNHIRIKQVLFVAACVANATTMGITIGPYDCDDIESPFFRDTVSEASARAACMNEFADLHTYLRPCVTQLMYKHHPYIDILPFPTFRERIIKLACADEPMIDEDDLCKDLSENDGLICWGSSLGGGSAVTGTGAPWDIRSWEAQPWFLKKWWILIGGKEGEIYKQTQWWSEMRGERSCYPW